MIRNAQRPQALLLLEDGSLYEGKAIGKKGTTGGELCFNTGMTGYQEIYTDPSYFGQLMIQTMAHTGNYGVIAGETESDSVKIAGLICGEFSQLYSRTGGSDNLDNYLEENGVVGICGIDTRKLVRHIREKGAMNAVISSEPMDRAQLQSFLEAVPSMEALELASSVMTPKSYRMGTEGHRRVAVLDFGIKQNILNQLVAQELECMVFPGNSPLEDLLAFEPEGFFVSNGPGDPASMDYAVATLSKIAQLKKPVFGICLGHQLLARTFGISTYKMKNGHRGLNHPVKNLISGHCEVTSQNHGFAVKREDLEGHTELILTHINLNDNTVEGLAHRNGQLFSVQYHPEASPGPHDSRYLFAQFKGLLDKQHAD